MQPGRVRVALGVPGEDAVAVHVVDVEVEAVAGDVALAELARQLEDLLGAARSPSATGGCRAPTAAAASMRPVSCV